MMTLVGGAAPRQSRPLMHDFLIGSPLPGIVLPDRDGGSMRSRAALAFVVALAGALFASGCTGGGASDREEPSRCPKPVAYDEATLKRIQAALQKLSPDNILHQAMADYENERDDLRFCR